MKNRILLILILLLTNMSFSQSLTIYKTDQTQVNFELADVDSITFSVTSFAKPLDPSNPEFPNTGPAVEMAIPEGEIFEKVPEELKINSRDNQNN